MADIPPALTLELVTPRRTIVHESVDEVVLPGTDGYFGVLPGHTPFLSTLAIGEMWYRKGTERTYLVVASGFAEVLPDRVTVLAEIAERADEIDVPRAEAAFKRAEARVQRPTAEVDFERARVALTKALVRIQVARRPRSVVHS
jgi:F-type H+-transporting ATPase subunit epsilon